MSDLAKLDRMQSVLQDLYSEFDRLNLEHFSGRLKTPVVELSTRKMFGGYYQKAKHRIVLSWQAYLEHGWEETLNTFRHEVAHIVHNNHRPVFWDLAQRLGVTRRYAAAPIKARRPSSRIYIYACPSCGVQLRRKRRMRNSSCARCDSTYNPKFRLQLIKEETGATAP